MERYILKKSVKTSFKSHIKISRKNSISWYFKNHRQEKKNTLETLKQKLKNTISILHLKIL